MILEGLVLWLGARWLKGRLEDLELAPESTKDPFVDLTKKHGITHEGLDGRTHTWQGDRTDGKAINISYQHQELHIHQHFHHYNRHDGL